MFSLQPPRHISTLPEASFAAAQDNADIAFRQRLTVQRG